MCENLLKKIFFVIRYVFDCYKAPDMCDKVILENGGLLKFVPDCYKNKK